MTGKYKSPEDFEEGDLRRANPRFSKENFENNFKIVEELEKVAQKKNCTPGQLTLAWVIAQGYIPIPGTKQIDRLEENFGAGKIDLTPEELTEIRGVIDKANIQGTRYQAAQMASLGH